MNSAACLRLSQQTEHDGADATYAEKLRKNTHTVYKTTDSAYSNYIQSEISMSVK